MKGFSTHNGDVVLDKDIQMTEGAELLRQKAVLVIGTNKGEWSYDTEEGIDFRVLLCKNPDEDEIRAEVQDALSQIDETFTLTEFGLTMRGREAEIKFQAVNQDGVEVRGDYTYGG